MIDQAPTFAEPEVPSQPAFMVPASNESTPGPVDALEILLRPGLWFRVRDYKCGDDRWLCLGSVHRAQDRVGFSGVEGSTVLGMRISQFLEDLRSGMAEPLHPDAHMQRALRQLRSGVDTMEMPARHWVL
jgi:hypothetical protein